ncbi:MAG TPA: S1C family serine protease [Acidimicrobiia bacterium]|nr:S1C family serine protease [Acidimicrobiia bacterium]
MSSILRRLLVAGLAISLVLAACGGEVSPTSTTGGTTTTSSALTTSTLPEGMATDIDTAPAAVVQIVAQGTFVDPEIGAYEAAGSGSGFIIDPSGIAVTNNHVVTGAGLLQVYVGEDDTPLNARILGVSECSDLAVIDIDGEGFPFLGWYEQDIRPGIDVYAAGYPLGDPQFTLTRGIVSKADTAVETEWASVDHVIEHDARINPGNSGGPLITEDALVIGINYAGRSDTDQNYAISVTEARGIVDQLQAGADFESIGVNGVAVFDQAAGVSGIWVSSVASGSPADQTGITGGDILTNLEGITLGSDGTMSSYCDVIRTHSADDPMRVEVLRWNTSQVLAGQINGDALTEAFSFAEELEDDVTADPSLEPYSEFVLIQDDTGAVQVEVPVEWSDVDGAPYTDEAGNYIIDVRASSSLDAFISGWDTPGMILSASSDLLASLDEVTILDEVNAGLEGTCNYEGRSPYSDPAYEGQYDLYTNCGGVGATFVVVAAVPADRSYLILVQIQANAERDFEALDRILNTFVAIGDV